MDSHLVQFLHFTDWKTETQQAELSCLDCYTYTRISDFPSVGHLDIFISLKCPVATPSSILAWRISWTEDSGRQQFMGSKEWDTTWVTKPPPNMSSTALKIFHIDYTLCTFFRLFPWVSFPQLRLDQKFITSDRVVSSIWSNFTKNVVSPPLDSTIFPLLNSFSILLIHCLNTIHLSLEKQCATVLNLWKLSPEN